MDFVNLDFESNLESNLESESNLNLKGDDFKFKLNRTTNNYSIYDKNGKRIQLTIKNVYLKFGLESYNNSEILNIEIRDRSNYHMNTILILKDLDNKLHSILNTDLEYYHIINQTKPRRYMVRTYLKNGAKITHSKYVGTFDKTNLKHTYCDITLELGSIWFTDEKYGCTIYVSSIVVLKI